MDTDTTNNDGVMGGDSQEEETAAPAMEGGDAMEAPAMEEETPAEGGDEAMA